MPHKNPQAVNKALRLVKTSPPRRKKASKHHGGGAPLGNKNNLQHGFYSQCISDEEKKLLKQDFNSDETLAILRVKALRLAKLTPLNAIENKELMALDRFFRAMQEMNTIERTKILAHGHGGELGKTILEALDEMDPDDLDI